MKLKDFYGFHLLFVSLPKAKESDDGSEKRESDPAAASGADETNLIDLDAGGGGSAESVSNGATTAAASDSKEAKKIAMLEGKHKFDTVRPYI